MASRPVSSRHTLAPLRRVESSMPSLQDTHALSALALPHCLCLTASLPAALSALSCCHCLCLIVSVSLPIIPASLPAALSALHGLLSCFYSIALNCWLAATAAKRRVLPSPTSYIRCSSCGSGTQLSRCQQHLSGNFIYSKTCTPDGPNHCMYTRPFTERLRTGGDR